MTRDRTKLDQSSRLRLVMDRRAFLDRFAALAGAGWLPSAARAQGARTRLILLGTGGGPRPRKASSAPAQVIVANGTAVRRRLRRRRRAPARLRRRSTGQAPARVHHASPLGPQRRLRQPDLAGVDGGPAHARRHLGTAASRENDEAVLRDERVRHRYPHRQRGPGAAGSARPRP